MHRASIRQIDAFLQALGTPIDLGVIYSARDGQERGYGKWVGQDIDSKTISQFLPAAARANACGAAIYIRMRESEAGHPGIVLLDDLSQDAVERLSADGWSPCATVETSSGNFQSWIRLIGRNELLPRRAVKVLIDKLILKYGADPRACSPVQLGRLPGFTNRKPKHRLESGGFPFVRLIATRPNTVAPAAEAMLAEWTQAGRAGAAPPETQAMPAGELPVYPEGIFRALSTMRKFIVERISAEVISGRRPITSGSDSEVDFALARTAIETGFSECDVSIFLNTIRPEKGVEYAKRTVAAAGGDWRPPAVRS